AHATGGAGIIGTVPLTLDAGALTGSAVLQTNAITAGTARRIVAVYSGDNGYATRAAIVGETVNKVASTLAPVSSSQNPQVFGGPVTFTTPVTGVAGAAAPTGNVTFTDAGTSIGTAAIGAGGVATLTTSALGVGSHNITVTYAGDSNYNA